MIIKFKSFNESIRWYKDGKLKKPIFKEQLTLMTVDVKRGDTVECIKDVIIG